MNTTTKERDSITGPNDRIDLVEKKALLSALWMFVLLNFIFRDLHEIVKAEFLADALNGIYDGREVTEAMFLLGGIIVEVPIAMMLMAWVLPHRANRWANVVVAPLFGLTLIGAPGDLDDYFHIGLVLMALATIAWQAWSSCPSNEDEFSGERADAVNRLEFSASSLGWLISYPVRVEQPFERCTGHGAKPIDLDRRQPRKVSQAGKHTWPRRRHRISMQRPD